MRREGMLFRSFDLPRPILVARGQRVLVGRRPPLEPQDARIQRDTVSRQHVRLGGAGGGCIVEHAGSTGGAMVNGARLTGVVPVGPEWLRFFLRHRFAVEPTHRPGHIEALTRLDGLGEGCSHPEHS